MLAAPFNWIPMGLRISKLESRRICNFILATFSHSGAHIPHAYTLIRSVNLTHTHWLLSKLKLLPIEIEHYCVRWTHREPARSTGNHTWCIPIWYRPTWYAPTHWPAQESITVIWRAFLWPLLIQCWAHETVQITFRRSASVPDSSCMQFGLPDHPKQARVRSVNSIWHSSFNSLI